MLDPAKSLSYYSLNTGSHTVSLSHLPLPGASLVDILQEMVALKGGIPPGAKLQEQLKRKRRSRGEERNIAGRERNHCKNTIEQLSKELKC